MSGSMSPIFMFVLLFLFLGLGIPIAFSLAAVAIIFAVPLWGINSLNLLVSAAWGSMNNFVVVAVPLFIYMAYILQKTNVVEDLYDMIFKWSGGLRGGLALATIVVGAILGAVSGVVAAGVIGLGLIGLPQMLRRKYDKNLAIGCVLGGGTLGQLVPPSTNMVIYGCVTGVSIGGLFAGGLSAGIFLAGLYIIYVLLRAFINPSLAPALPLEDRASWNEKLLSLRAVFFPALLIMMVLGTILKGVASPTEAAAFGAGGALLIGFLKRRLSWNIVYSSCYETLLVSSMVGWTMIGAGAFGAVFSGLGGNALVTNIAVNMPGGPVMVFTIFSIFIFFLGMFLEPGAIIFLAAPIMAPIIVRLGFDALWFGLVFNVLLQCGYLSPPFGLSLFYLHSCSTKGVNIVDIYRAGIPFLVIQIICVVTIFLFPQIVLWLPGYILGR